MVLQTTLTKLGYYLGLCEVSWFLMLGLMICLCFGKMCMGHSRESGITATVKCYSYKYGLKSWHTES